MGFCLESSKFWSFKFLLLNKMYFCHVKAAMMCCKELLKRMEPAKNGLKDPTWQEWTQEAYRHCIDLCATYLWVAVESFVASKLSYNKAGNIHIKNIEACLHNHCCREKTIIVTFSEYVSVALVIQCAKQMHCIILLSVACLALPYFSTLSHK